MPTQSGLVRVHNEKRWAAVEINTACDSSIQAKRDTIYQKSIDYIEENLDNGDLDITNVSSAACSSPRTLARAFAERGTSVMRHVWTRRLEFSFKLLSEGRVKHVSKAAYLCGFNDLSHFTRTFKKMFGSTPSCVLERRVVHND